MFFNAYGLYRFKRRLHHKGGIFDDVINSIRKLLKKNRREMIDEKLEKAGRPFRLTPEKYIMAKIGLFIFALAYIYLVEMERFQAISFVVLSFFADRKSVV